MMKWEHVDFIDRVWRIPDTKNKSPHTAPLSPQALEILHQRYKDKVNEWVFPGEGNSGHLIEPKRAWSRILKKANLSGIVIHDLRRTFGSWQTAVNGANLMIIGKSLGHKSPQSTQIYARLYIEPVRHSINGATQAMMDTISKSVEKKFTDRISPIFKSLSQHKIQIKGLNFLKMKNRVTAINDKSENTGNPEAENSRERLLETCSGSF